MTKELTKAKKGNLEKFAVFGHGRFIGEEFRAKDFADLINNRLPKRLNEWMCIKFIDDQGRTISISSDFMDEGMSFDECVDDWVQHMEDQHDDPVLILE